MKRNCDEQGSVTLEAVLVLPVLLLSIMAVVQVALFAHASNLANTAAREGTRSLRLTGQDDTGRERAAEFLHDHGAQVVLEPAVVAGSRQGVASVDVSGRAVSLIPGLSFPVHGHSAGPIEAFTGIATNTP
ncbi:MAG TPA: TadE/TadG family type IV pilus assembly protein [Acidimicrobiia bacterium]|nr:TadE/TadG family type IV pilus assembly protein [Acidimicrobiia bacterium]